MVLAVIFERNTSYFCRVSSEACCRRLFTCTVINDSWVDDEQLFTSERIASTARDILVRLV